MERGPNFMGERKDAKRLHDLIDELEAKYPMVRLRAIEGGSHVPAEVNYRVAHTSQQLAWIEGMATKDPARLAVAFERLSTVKEGFRSFEAAERKAKL
jgi:hypothetical protein